MRSMQGVQGVQGVREHCACVCDCIHVCTLPTVSASMGESLLPPSASPDSAPCRVEWVESSGALLGGWPCLPFPGQAAPPTACAVPPFLSSS